MALTAGVVGEERVVVEPNAAKKLFPTTPVAVTLLVGVSDNTVVCFVERSTDVTKEEILLGRGLMTKFFGSCSGTTCCKRRVRTSSER